MGLDVEKVKERLQNAEPYSVNRIEEEIAYLEWKIKCFKTFLNPRKPNAQEQNSVEDNSNNKNDDPRELKKTKIAERTEEEKKTFGDIDFDALRRRGQEIREIDTERLKKAEEILKLLKVYKIAKALKTQVRVKKMVKQYDDTGKVAESSVGNTNIDVEPPLPDFSGTLNQDSAPSAQVATSRSDTVHVQSGNSVDPDGNTIDDGENSLC